jgi:type II restriction/modification system DNA methylase subunit YeeA
VGKSVPKSVLALPGKVRVTPSEFVAKWRVVELRERQSSQTHFNDLCLMLGEPTPIEADPKGEWFCFERGASKGSGGEGWADVWKKGYFGWEYKGKHKDLKAAYRQLNEYREALENPPLLVVSDMDRFEIHTNFTGTAKKVHAFTLEELPEKVNLDLLRALFRKPEKLRPDYTPEMVTKEAAARVAQIAVRMEERGIDPHEAAHFLMQCIFCMFAEDIDLLPDHLFRLIVERTRHQPSKFAKYVQDLFEAMRTGGDVFAQEVKWFNGGLFVDDKVIELTLAELEILYGAASLDWSSVEPAIFGTLFERSLDPEKRHRLGMHYTSPEDIELVLQPVLFAPLREEWTQICVEVERLLALDQQRLARRKGPVLREKESTRLQQVKSLIGAFLDKLNNIRVLDPACGSGNFLYLALKGLKDLELEVIQYAMKRNLGGYLPYVSPKRLHGIEINPYAHQLAQIVVWIGYLQWMYVYGYPIASKPILEKFDNILEGDALLEAGQERPPWAEADFIVGNPPFIGGKLLRRTLGSDYVDRLFREYADEVPKEADYVLYWFERAMQAVERRQAARERQVAINDARVAKGQPPLRVDLPVRVGFVATQGIRSGPNRGVLERINGESGRIFMAWQDRPWVLDGADVRVSMVGFDEGIAQQRCLDGGPTDRINSDLSNSQVDLTQARRLRENLGIAFMGTTKGGKFNLTPSQAAEYLKAKNASKKPNTDVVVPWAGGRDIVKRSRGLYIIDFGLAMTEDEAALYEKPFGHVVAHVKSKRIKNPRAAYATRWWLHSEPRPAMRAALQGLPRYLATVRHMKHRVFVFLEAGVLPDSGLIAIAKDDWFTFGILQSKAHVLWATRKSGRIGVGNDPRYAATNSFETFPFPDNVPRKLEDTVEVAAKALYDLREGWLEQNPKQGMTDLYNEPPAWLPMKQKVLDDAVLAVYGWPKTLTDEQILGQLLDLNLSREGIDDPGEEEEEEEEEDSS